MTEPGTQITPGEKRDSVASNLPCIVGFGMDGVYVGVPKDTWSGPIEVHRVSRTFGHDAGGWRVDLHPRMLADTTGDGTKDIVGFGFNGVFIAKNSGSHTFALHALAIQEFGYKAGWRCNQHIRLLADLRGNGRADIIGFGDSGVFVSLNSGEGCFSSTTKAIDFFGASQGWVLNKHPRLLADTTGDGLPDIVGFGEKQTFIARNQGDGTFGNARADPNLDDFCFEYGWRVDQHPRLVVDITGNGRADILGFKNDGVFVSLNDGRGNFRPMTLAVHEFGTCQGWQTDLHPRFVLPLTPKRTPDIIGFGHPGVYVSINNGDGTFGRPKLVLEEFGVSQGWRIDRHPRFLVDLTGDGCPDIIGFAENAIWISYNDGKGSFGPPQKQSSRFCANQGWVNNKTVRFVDAV